MFWKYFTIFMIIGDYHFPLFWPEQCLGNLGNVVPLGLWSVKEVTSAWLLHDIWPGESGHLTEPIIAVDDSTVLNSSISNDEFFICKQKDVMHFSVIWQHFIKSQLPGQELFLHMIFMASFSRALIVSPGWTELFFLKKKNSFNEKQINYFQHQLNFEKRKADPACYIAKLNDGYKCGSDYGSQSNVSKSE